MILRIPHDFDDCLTVTQDKFLHWRTPHTRNDFDKIKNGSLIKIHKLMTLKLVFCVSVFDAPKQYVKNLNSVAIDRYMIKHDMINIKDAKIVFGITNDIEIVEAFVLIKLSKRTALDDRFFNVSLI